VGYLQQIKLLLFLVEGKVIAGQKVEVTNSSGDVEIIESKNIIIATGSSPIEIGSAKFDNKNILDSTGALEIDSVPKTLGVIGAGVIGLELGSVWARLGSKVTVIEAMDDFLFMADKEIAKETLKDFKKQGLDIKAGLQINFIKKS
jgi:dihydrolipoamide dehydrogenase